MTAPTGTPLHGALKHNFETLAGALHRFVYVDALTDRVGPGDLFALIGATETLTAALQAAREHLEVAGR